MVSRLQPSSATVPRLGRSLADHVRRSVAPSRPGRFHRLRERSQVPPRRPERVEGDDRIAEGRRARPDVAGEPGQASGQPCQTPERELVLRRRPAFEQLRLVTINHARGSRHGSTPQSAGTPVAANRALEILRVMLSSARKWRDLGKRALDACAGIVRNPRRPIARYLDHAEFERLGAVLDRRREEHPWPAAATGYRHRPARACPKPSFSRGTKSATTVQTRVSKTPKPDRAPAGSDRKRRGCSPSSSEHRARNACSPGIYRQTGPTHSGWGSATRPGRRVPEPLADNAQGIRQT